MHPSGSTVSKRSPLSLIPQQTLAALLAQSGYQFGLIADAINSHNGPDSSITRQQVAFDVAQVIDSHRSIAPTDPEEIRILQIARLEMISNLALQGFLDSATTDTTTESTDADGQKRTGKSRKRSAGDAKFLAIMGDVERERSKILGSYAPERREEVGQLTVTFAWKDAPALLSTATPDATEGTFRLAESADSDAHATPYQTPTDDENG